jgi:L-fuconolactonase
MIIDAHQHFWDLARGDYRWLMPAAGVLYRNFLPTDLAEALRANKVDATILVQAAATESETHYLLELAHTHSFIAGVVGWVDLEALDAPRRIEALTHAGGGKLKGVRPMIQDIEDSEWLLRPSLDAAFDALIANDLAFDALVRPVHFEPLRKRLLRHPRLRAVLDHAGKPDIALGEYEGWARDLARLADDTPLQCKLSGLLTQAGHASYAAKASRLATHSSCELLLPYVAHLIDAFGAERVMWGSDWPVLNAVSEYAAWLEVSYDLVRRFAPGHIDEIFGTNAHRFYQLARL